MTGGHVPIIREAKAADRAAMLDLWVEAWSRMRPEIDFAARRTWIDCRLDAMGAGTSLVSVAEDESGAVLGFVTIDLVTGELDQLVTGVSAQGRGVGQAMIRWAKQQSPEGLSLTVNQCNDPAIRLYRREGFAVVGHGLNPVSGLPVWYMRWPNTRIGPANADTLPPLPRASS